MRSPLGLAQRVLEYLETSFVPYRSIWWRFWTPSMEKGDRYQDGYFSGYGDPEDDMSWIDIRRAIGNPLVRKVYKSLPYVDVNPVARHWDVMTEDEQTLRELFASGATKAVYSHGKALYLRETIRSVEDQLEAYERARRPVSKVLRRCEAPQTAFVRYRDFDGVMQHQGTWKPGAITDGGYSDVAYGRSQIEFRTIQELVIPDPDNLREVYAPDQWEASVAYNTISVCSRLDKQEMVNTYGDEDDQLGAREITQRLDAYRSGLDSSPEWKAVAVAVAESRALRSIDKIVFFYATGFSDDCDYCKRALFMLSIATRLRDLALTSRDGTEGKTRGVIPIYMPAFSIDRIWNSSENEVLLKSGVIPIDSNGELVLKIDEKTAVISYRHWNPVKQIVADIARPAIMICKPVAKDKRDFLYRVEDRDEKPVKLPLIRARDIDNSIVSRDPDSPRVREMLRDYDECKLPELPGDTYPEEQMSCYLRKPHTRLQPDYYQ